MESALTDWATVIAFVGASAAVAIVPGPTVSLIVANSLRSGAGAGLANIAGTQVGLFTMIAVLALGLEAVVALMGEAFVVLKLIGAAYLVYLGIKLLRSDGALPQASSTARSLAGYGVQGFLVIWSNPKALLFFGAFIPQFVRPGADPLAQVVLYGVLFMAVTTVLDGAYALAAGRLGRLLTRARVKLVERVSGACLIVGGLWLASVRRG